MRSVAKYVLKMWIAHPVRSMLVRLFAPRADRNGWDDRLLIVNLEALGDLAIFTGVLKHYRAAFPGRSITLLMKAGTGIEPFLHPSFVDEIITVDYRRFAVDPFYGYSVIASLRKTGFHMVVNQDFSSSEIMGKIISVSLGANRVVGSDGLSVEYDNPFDIQQKKNQDIVNRRILPRYTKVVPTRGIRGMEPGGRLRSELWYYSHIFEATAGSAAVNYAPQLAIPEDVSAVLGKFGLDGRRYAVLNVGASVAYKRWPIERFVGVAQTFRARSITPVVIGAQGDKTASERFVGQVPESVDLAGKTSLKELAALIAESELVLTNDTSTVHMAIALKKPSLCITGGGQFGMQADYGYPDANVWAYVRTPCYGDNFRCGRLVPEGSPSPCVSAVPEAMVREKLIALLDRIEKARREGRNVPGREFEIEFASQT